MAEFENNNHNFENGDSSFDIKKIVYIILHQWYWFVLFGILGLALSFLYTRVQENKYVASTSVLLKDQNNGVNVSDLFQGYISRPRNSVYDQIAVIKSYDVVNKALKSLGWKVSWYKDSFWKWDELYKSSPFVVNEAPGFQNPTGKRIYITPLSKTLYKLKAEFEYGKNKTSVEIDTVGTYGKPFVNKYLHFTLSVEDKNYNFSNSKFYFVFNNLSRATLKYSRRINASTLDKVPRNDVIVCSMEGTQPEKEVDFLNRLISTYIQEKLKVQNETQQRTLNFINGQLKEISDSVRHASEDFIAFKAKNKIVDPTTEGGIVMDSLAKIESAKASLQLQIEYNRRLVQYLSSNVDSIQGLIAPSVVGNSDAVFGTLVTQMNDLLNQKAILGFSARQDNPAMQLLDEQISRTRGQILQSLHGQINNQERFMSVIKAREDTVTQMLTRLPRKEQQMIMLQNKFTMINQIYTFLLQNKAQTSITMAANVPDVRVIDEARLQTTYSVGTPPRVFMIGGFFFGLLLPVVFLILRSFFDDRIRTQDDVENNTRLPILANIIHSPVSSDLAVLENSKSNLAESFRTLRTNLQFMLNGADGGKVIGIHSVNPSEGKSFNSVNLATIMAMNNKSVVLIGADLRKPRLHKIFNVSNDFGLSTYLIGQDTVDKIIQKTRIDNLSFIASGPIPPNPAEILGKQEMQTLIDKLRSKFDYIVIDNAPVGLVTDGIITSQITDVNIFILRYGVSRSHNLEFINQEADRKSINHVALVVNDIKAGAFGSTYYKYYRYEYYQHAYYSEEEHKQKLLRRKKRRQKK